jgi:hypothetical protein
MVIAVTVMVATIGLGRERGDGGPVGSAGSSAAARTAGQASVVVSAPTATAAATPTPVATAAPIPTRSAAVTAPPRASGPPRLAYAAFLARVNDDRATVDSLDAALSAAAEAQDADAVRRAAVGILDFVDGERDWLREHPPADCYTAAHAAASEMLDAYGTAADKSIAWAAAGSGLAGLIASGQALDAAQAASAALTSFGTVLVATRCPA